jgi:hypothetical protein
MFDGSVTAIRILIAAIRIWIGVWIWIWIWIWIIEGKGCKERKTEVVDNNDTVVVMKPIISMEVVETAKTRAGVHH